MSIEVAASTQLAAAMQLLRQYYSMTGRPDLIEIPEKQSQEDAKASDGTALPAEEAVTPTVPRAVVEDLMFLLMDNTEGAYFVKDLMTDQALLSKFSVAGSESVSYDGMEKYVQIFYEGSLGIGDDVKFYISKIPEVPAELADPDNIAGGEFSMRHMAVPVGPFTPPDSPPSDTAEETSVFNLNEEPTLVPDRFQQPSLVAFVFPNLRIGPSTRNTGAVSLFANAIPSVEMSRCVPHIKITLVSSQPYGTDQKSRQLSILRFLGMNTPANDGIGMLNAMPVNMTPPAFSADEAEKLKKADPTAPEDVSILATDISVAGMELFTSPQTMVNANINNEDGGFTGAAGGVLDPFLPLMTLEKLNIRIAGLGQALHANKTGSLSFILHDRSRMSDIAPLLAVDLFSQTHLVIEWGWNHPDGFNAAGNAYGSLLHSMKSVGSFNIVASNFTIGNDGQVRVDMRLASRGASEIKAFPVGTGALVPITPFKEMLNTYLAKKLEVENAKAEGKDAGSAPANNLAEVRSKVRLSMNNASSPSSVIDRETFLKFLEIVSPVKDAVIVPSELTDIIKELVGDPADDDDPGLLAISNKSLENELTAKTDLMIKTVDAFYPLSITRHLKESIDTTVGEDGNPPFVSLGKIIMTFVGAPLAGCARFDEVQVMFYRFNINAGAAGRLDSIANFLVNEQDFQDHMGKYSSASPTMSIQSFINFVNSKIISVPTDINYGLTALQNELTAAQQKSSEEAANPDETVKKDIQQEIKLLDNELEMRLKEIYADGPRISPEFHMPKLSMLLEAVPAFVAYDDKEDNAPTFQIDPSKVILRVHIFDKNASPHTDEMFLINCMNDSTIASLLKTSSDTSTAEAAEAEPGLPVSSGNSGTLDKAIEDSKIIALDTDGSYEAYTAAVSNTELKRIIKNTVPSLTYGQGFTALTNFNMRSTTGGSVGTAMLINAVTSAPSRAGGSKNATNSMEDITVIPANASMTMMGCPLVEYGQEFFLDLGTGTTADNMYRVSGVEHNISPGEFTTNVTLGFNGSGTMSVFRSILTSALAGLEKESAEAESE